mgnify:CR=1 FL=1
MRPSRQATVPRAGSRPTTPIFSRPRPPLRHSLWRRTCPASASPPAVSSPTGLISIPTRQGPLPATPGPLPVIPQPQPLAPPAPVSAPPLVVTRTTSSPSPTRWRRDRIIALITTLIACGAQIVWVLYDLHRQPRFTAPPGFTLDFILYLLFYALSTPGVWWFFLHFSSLKAIF